MTTDKPDAWPEDAGPYPQQPLDAQASGGARTLFFAAVVLFIHALVLGSSLVATLIVGPRCDKVLRDLNMTPTTVALFALGVSRWLNNYWYVLILFLVPCLVVDGAVLLLLHREQKTRRRSYIWALAILLVIVLFSGCLGGSLYTLNSQIAGWKAVPTTMPASTPP
jgi:cytochrome bd-type quinol oxidase subunit 2